MSVVTNVILSGLGGFDPEYTPRVITHLNNWLRENEVKGQLVEVSKHVESNKAMEAFLWIGAFNYLAVGDFVQAYRDIVPTLALSRYSAQLLIKRQEDSIFYHVPQTREEDGGYNWDAREDRGDYLRACGVHDRLQ